MTAETGWYSTRDNDHQLPALSQAIAKVLPALTFWDCQILVGIHSSANVTQNSSVVGSRDKLKVENKNTACKSILWLSKQINQANCQCRLGWNPWSKTSFTGTMFFFIRPCQKDLTISYHGLALKISLLTHCSSDFLYLWILTITSETVLKLTLSLKALGKPFRGIPHLGDALIS